MTTLGQLTDDLNETKEKLKLKTEELESTNEELENVKKEVSKEIEAMRIAFGMNSDEPSLF